MSARKPRVGGVAGGVGTSVIAGLIGAVDCGVVDDRSEPVDVLVCRSVSSDLVLATRLAAVFVPHPVVVINADCGDSPPAPVRDRARMLEPNVPALVWFPWMKELRSLTSPVDALRHAVLAEPPERWVVRARARRESLLQAVLPLVTSAQTNRAPPADEAHTADNRPLHPPTALTAERLRRTS